MTFSGWRSSVNTLTFEIGKLKAGSAKPKEEGYHLELKKAHFPSVMPMLERINPHWTDEHSTIADA